MQLTVFFVACLLGVALGKKNGPGQMCTSCNKARDSEEACNNQDIEGGNEKQCKDNQVCTTDVRCDGQGRLYFIKGCEKAAKITAANTLICNDDFTRCNYHCDQGDFCNLNAPPAVWESLVCYSKPTTAPTTTPEPPTTPVCRGGVPTSGPGTSNCQCTCTCGEDCSVTDPPTTESPACELMDLVLIIDCSRHVNDLSTFKSFYADLVDGLDIGSSAVQVGLICYSGFVVVELELGSTNDKGVIQTAIASLSKEGHHSAAHLYEAVDTMVNMFQTSGRSNARKVGIVTADREHFIAGHIAVSMQNARSALPDLQMIAALVPLLEIQHHSIDNYRMVATGLGTTNTLSTSTLGSIGDLVTPTLDLMCHPPEQPQDPCAEILMIYTEYIWMPYFGVYELTEETCPGDSHPLYKHIHEGYWMYYDAGYSGVPFGQTPAAGVWAVSLTKCGGTVEVVIRAASQASPDSLGLNWFERVGNWMRRGVKTSCF